MIGVNSGGPFVAHLSAGVRAGATARAHLCAGVLLIVAPDHYLETFMSPSVDDDTNSDGETTLTYVEYSIDLDPADSTVETAYVFFIARGGELRVEVDRHTTGMFPLATWERLLAEAGFAWERVDYPVSEDGTAMVAVGALAGCGVGRGRPSTGSGRTGVGGVGRGVSFDRLRTNGGRAE